MNSAQAACGSTPGHCVSVVTPTFAALRWTARDPARSINILSIAGLAELVGLGDVRGHRRSGSL